MDVMTEKDVIDNLERDREVRYGSIFSGVTDREVKWKLVKTHKNNDTSKDKQYLVDGYYFGIYIGQALLKYEEGVIEIDFITTERKSK